MRRTDRHTASTHGGKVALGLLSAMIAAACGGGPGPEPVEPTGPAPLFVRHWDQVCAASRDPIFLQTGELVDTAGLSDELKAAGALGLGPSDEPEELGLVIWYERSGQLEAAARWETNMPPERAAIAEQIIASRIRPLDQLLTQSSFYVVLDADAAEPVLRIDRARECMPHMRHPDNGRPYGLPDSVTTWHGRQYSRRDTTVASVRIHIDRQGFPADVDSLGGPGWAIQAARELIPRLSFDPALLNGRTVSGTLAQNFRFR